MTAKPAYPEAESRRWLAWLAGRMQQQGETVFLIERLQPDCLTNGRTLWIYGFLSGIAAATLVFSVFATLLSLVLYASADPDTDWVAVLVAPIFGPVVGLPVGTVLGLAVIARFERRPAWSFVAGILAAATLVGMLALLSLAGTDLETAMGLAVLIAPFAVLWIRRIRARTIDTDIRLTETLQFSWTTFRQRAFRFSWWFLLWWPLFLIQLIRALFAAYRTAPVARTTHPNEGIRRSVRNAVAVTGTWALIGGVAGLTIALLALLFGDLRAPDLLRFFIGGAAGLSLVGMFLGFTFGALDAVSHYTLRLVLFASGRMPLRYDAFLDHAAQNLGFLQRVGGGYMFIHRYLLEHFARMQAPESDARPELVTAEGVPSA